LCFDEALGDRKDPIGSRERTLGDEVDGARHDLGELGLTEERVAGLVDIVIVERQRGGPVVNPNIVLFDERRTWPLKSGIELQRTARWNEHREIGTRWLSWSS
jgi:hypothetical protein